MASKNLKQRLVVALCSEASASKMLECISNRSELPDDIKSALIIGMADKRMGREVSNAVDTGASLSQKTIKQLVVMLADNSAADELKDLLENTAFDEEAGVGPEAPVEPPVYDVGEDSDLDPAPEIL
jgi:hypothetical protein